MGKVRAAIAAKVDFFKHHQRFFLIFARLHGADDAEGPVTVPEKCRSRYRDYLKRLADIFAEGIRCGFVSNGNATPEVLEFIRPYVDLYKVDLKGFDDRNYRKLGGVLDNVLGTIRLLKKMDFWVEVVTLVVPGLNDGDEELKQIADFIAGLSCDIPWHVTAFHPDYKMTGPPRTPADTLIKAYDIGKAAGLRYVYPGNLPRGLGKRENTYCHSCEKLLIRRRGFVVEENRMKGGACPFCKEKVAGVWEDRPPSSTTGFAIPLPITIVEGPCG